MCKKISVEIIGEEALVKTPYNRGFVSAIKKIGGARWTGEAWKIPAEALNEAREMMLKHYGETDQADDEKITVRATFLQDVEELTDSVTSLGKTIARATGRDSGARVGEDAVLVKGRIGSGGSMKNWTSWVENGSVFILHNVSKALYERGYDQYNEEIATYEIVDEGADHKAKLNEEKERLLKRIAEIEEELKKQ